jgi:hypothetical protein
MERRCVRIFYVRHSRWLNQSILLHRLQVIRGNALCASKGYAAQEVEETFSRAYKLGKELNDPQYLLPLLWGLYAVSFCRAQYKKALAYGEEFLRLAEAVKAPTLVIGHAMVGSSLCLDGRT